MSGALPTFVIIGAQKCGTTALHSYLARHPQISMSRPKELDFFVTEKNWDMGLDWYCERWNGPDKPSRGESSPNYTAYPKLKGVPERMAGLIPDAKLIFMVRDPIDRVRAGYLHRYANRAESRPMREAVLAPEQTYVSRSQYHLQLTQFLEHYPMERILVLEQDELLSDRRQTLERVYEFLGVDKGFWRKTFNEPRLETARRGRRTRLGVFAANRVPPRVWRKLKHRRLFAKPYEKPELDDAFRAELADILRDDVAAFRELTGRRFESWSL
jgi:Sulfotransferase domain